MTEFQRKNFHELVSEFSKQSNLTEIAEIILLSHNDQELGTRIRKYFTEKVKNFETNVKKI